MRERWCTQTNDGIDDIGDADHRARGHEVCKGCDDESKGEIFRVGCFIAVGHHTEDEPHGEQVGCEVEDVRVEEMIWPSATR